jgi:hypothetical protein
MEMRPGIEGQERRKLAIYGNGGWGWAFLGKEGGGGHFGTYRLCCTPEMPSDIHAEMRRVHGIA